MAANIRNALFCNVAFAGLAIAALSACGPAPAGHRAIKAPPELAGIRLRVLQSVDAGEIPSMAIAVAREGEIIWMEGLGWADKESAQPATPGTVYAIGSTSKSMTATLAMALSEKGLFDIDREVDEYLDASALRYLSADGEFPTARELLTMTGGVPHGGGVTGTPEFTATREAIARRSELVAYPPGTLYEYSNYSIGLAMRAMEGATGVAYGELMQRYVFEPLGMKDSSVSYRDDAQWATLYDSDAEPIDDYRFYPEAAGGFYSSVADLMRFAMFHAGHWAPEETVISTENLSLMHTARPSSVPGAIAAIGFGRLEMTTTGIAQLISNGNVRGGNAHVSILQPTGDIVITALNMTSRNSAADSLALDIAEALHPGIKEDFGNLVAAHRQGNQQSFDGDPAWTGQWRGALEGEGYLSQIELQISDKGEIDIRLDDASALPVGNVRFSYGTVLGSVEGLIGSGAQPIRLALHDGTLYGHIVVRSTNGQMRGSYPYRMRLALQSPSAMSNK